jgi:hypothetical protein
VHKLVNSKASFWNQIKKLFRRLRRFFFGTPIVEEPESIINLYTILPSIIGLGEVLPLSFSFTNDSSTEAPVAAIKILEVTHEIIAQTIVQASGKSENRRNFWRFKANDGLPFVKEGERVDIDVRSGLRIMFYQ